MRNVARVHFGLTVFFAALLFFWDSFPYSSNLIQSRVVHAIWGQFWLDVLKLFQPLSYLVVSLLQEIDLHFKLPDQPFWGLVPIYYGVLLVSCLFWSICFGRIVVRLDNWLNHFPVLGKKVF